MLLDRLEKIQKRATKLIQGLRDLKNMIRRTTSGMWTDNTRNAKIKGGSNISVEDIEWL